MKQFEFTGQFCNLPKDFYLLLNVEKLIGDEWCKYPILQITDKTDDLYGYHLLGNEIRIFDHKFTYSDKFGVFRVTYQEKQ